MASAKRDIDTADPAALDAFLRDLLSLGFQPEERIGAGAWIGPLPDDLAELLGKPSAIICIRDGWPFIRPTVQIPGLVGRHVTRSGEVCLWRPHDTGAWTTPQDVVDRLRTWANAFVNGFGPEDAARDAHLYFERTASRLALVDLTTIVPHQEGAHTSVHAVDKGPNAVALLPGPSGGKSQGVLAFYRDHIDTIPADYAQFRDSLTEAQRAQLAFRTRLGGTRLRLRYVLLVWPEFGNHNALALRLSSHAGAIVAESVEVAPVDQNTVRLRAGRDAAALEEKHVLVVGAGALGSHVALLLAKAGCQLTIRDGQRLRPGDVVRHAASHSLVGRFKSEATTLAIAGAAPHAVVSHAGDVSLGRTGITDACNDADLVVDCTGDWNVTNALSMRLHDISIPLVSASLYRSGQIIRVRRQHEDDMAIHARGQHPDRYPLIPPSSEPDVTFETGCGGPVNNASPIAVATAAALTAQYCVDILSGRLELGAEAIQILQTNDADGLAEPSLLFFDR